MSTRILATQTRTEAIAVEACRSAVQAGICKPILPFKFAIERSRIKGWFAIYLVFEDDRGSILPLTKGIRNFLQKDLGYVVTEY